ncbi:uncharacterized protein PV09_08035 [Verruconis gallopava]|uniref:Uncharacterized protein n=1 Tax=Verruconis gallopava TaxID=253628 RepID=A0A0D1YHJ3_9PEZI|nr:uncharacterized protein PV09_08035 [Verruconis gallopava]KIW00322.1 hypothetical protein PV09_08035 [Verruconis gallopava]
MAQNVPKRIVLKCPERHGNIQYEMITAFFKAHAIQFPEDDVYTHILFEPSSPSSLFFVLDIHCKTIPHVNLSQLELQIFQVSKNKPFEFRDLGESGREQARPRSLTTAWGTDKRVNQTS